MADKMEMSLDDIIKSSKSLKVRRDNGAPPRRGRKTRGGDRPIHKGGRPAPTGAQRQGGNSDGNGTVLKGRNRGGIQKPKFSKGNVNNAWKHDKYDGPKHGKGWKTVNGSTFGGPSKLLVSNLDYGVSELDITELFADFGPLKSASVHYDRSGHSLGTADLVFERRVDAVKAMKQYNGVSLDGRPMNIQLLKSEVPSAVSKARLGSVVNRPRAAPAGNGRRGAVGGGQKRGSAPRRGGGGAPGGRRNAAKSPTMTTEELDAELDAYVTVRDVNKA